MQTPKLNDRQRAAIEYNAGPLLVLAGAGSGKTRVITHKIAHLINREHHAPQHIAAVTFTNKAAREMKQRVAQLLDSKLTRGLSVSTFHTLGLNILRAELASVGLRSGFTIFDATDSQALLRDLLGRQAGGEQSTPAQIRISNWKNALITPEMALEQCSGDAIEYVCAKVYAEYTRHLRAYNAVDFDDLIALPALLFQSDADALQRWRYRLRYLLVDEYQDTNAGQYQLLKMLTGQSGKLTVVGDDDQSIYAWRGAQPENLALLKNDYPHLQIIKLEQNYRSMGNILKVANHLIANNPHVFEKTLWSEMGYGEPIKVITASDEDDEAERVVDMLHYQKVMRRASYHDFAILYRSNHQSRVFERALRERKIPYHLSGGTSFFDFSEVKDILAYLRLLVNPDDDPAFLRIVNTPRRELGPATVEKLAEYATARGISLYAASGELGLSQRLSARSIKNLTQFIEWIEATTRRLEAETPAETARQIIRDICYQDWLSGMLGDERAAERRMKNVMELVDWLERKGGDGESVNAKRDSLADLICKLALLDIMDRQTEDNPGDRVQMMTLHAAKGLEFGHVFMVGMEENILPHRNSIEADTIEEERRLCYVGITRAQKSLVFTLAAKRKRYRDTEVCEPSRFLSELPAEDLAWESGSRGGQVSVTKEEGRQTFANLRRLLMEGE